MPDLVRYLRWGFIALALVIVGAILLSDFYRPVFISDQGIAQGALIAAIALGVVLTFQGSGVVNLANGVIAMYAAYVYAILRADGDLFLPPVPNPLVAVEWLVHLFQADDSLDLPDIPTFVSLGPSMQFWPALLLSVLFCVLLGLILHFFVFWPLRKAPPLAKIVASVGVFLLLQAVILHRFAATSRAVRPLPFIDKEPVELGIVELNEDRVFVAAFVIVATVVLSWVFRRTRFGLATRAAAENEKGAIGLGLSPGRLAALNWVLSMVITGLLGILVASISSTVNPFTIPALIIPALTAALVGGFRSFGWTTFAAFVLGMLGPLIERLGVREDWFPKAAGQPIPGVGELVPLLVIVAVLFLWGNTLPDRGAVSPGRLPAAPAAGRTSLAVVGPAMVAVTLLAVLFWLPPTYRGALTTSLIGVIICLSIVVVTGFVGQISLAPMAFAGISAFVVAELSTDRGWPFPIPIFAGAVVALLVGLVVAIPALRIRGVNLGIVTLAFVFVAQELIFANPDVNGGLEGAPVDTPGVLEQTTRPTYSILGIFEAGDGKQPNPMTAGFVLMTTVILCYLVANLRRSTTGRQLLAVRSNERAAAGAGVNVAATKALAFGLSAFIAGVAGAVIVYRSGAATENRFTFEQSLAFFAFAYIGGISRVSGAVAGGLLVAGGLAFTLGQDTFSIPEELTLLLGGFALIVASIVAPEGVAALHGRAVARSAGADDDKSSTVEVRGD